MSIECGECERDHRGGHDPSCSRYSLPANKMPERIWAGVNPSDGGWRWWPVSTEGAATEYVKASALNEAREANDALRKRVAELEGALEPFAKAANEILEHSLDETHIGLGIQLGHCRRARATLGGTDGR